MNQQKEKRLEYMRQYLKNWREKHPDYTDYMKQYLKNWRKKHFEYIKQYFKDWKERHPEYMEQYLKNWRERHLETMRQYRKKWREKHPEYHENWRKRNHDRWLGIVKKAHDKHRRNYPTNIILNDYFKGSHLHHLTPWVAMYIPDEMHNSIRHNLRTGKNMYEINRKALDFWLKRGVQR